MIKGFSILTAAIAVLVLAGCGSPPPSNQPQASNANQTNQPAAETKPAATVLSPTDTLKALNAAAKARDPETIKKYLSAGTLAILEETAKQEKKSVDDILRSDPPLTLLAETSNEEVSGETATVQMREAPGAPLDKVPLVKENGEWKVALDVYLEEFERRMAEGDKAPGESNSNTEDAPKP